MPYLSKAQDRYFNANRKTLEARGVDVDEWNRASRGKKLPARVKKGVKSVKKLLFALFFSDEELQVVDEQAIEVPVFASKIVGAPMVDGVDVFVDEFFRCGVKDAGLRERLAHGIADGMQKMGFAQTYTPV